MTFLERLTCAKNAIDGLTDAQIAQALGWSKWSVRKWRQAYGQDGEDGLVSRMRRPQRGVLSSFPVEVQDELETLRRMHPGWGPIT